VNVVLGYLHKTKKDMMKKWKYIYLVLIYSMISLVGNAQLSVQGLLHIQDEAALHVWNDVEITTENGVIENSGTIEVEGNWTKNTEGRFNGNPSGSGERLVVFRNNDFNTTSSQRITGTMSGDNSFFNLAVDNTGEEKLVDLANSIDISNNLNFSNGRIRTDVISNGAGDGNAYTNTLTLSNPSVNAITGQTTTSGTDRYIEGKLIRAVEGMGTYSFPVGISPDLMDGAEPYEVSFTTPAPLSNISSAFQIGATSSTGETRICDVGIAPNFNIPDGSQDQLTIDCIAGQWITASDNADYNFDIVFFPGSNFLSSCNEAVLFYVANNEIFDDCPDLSGNTGIEATSQTDFGIFDIPTVSMNAITTSIELIDQNDARINISPNPGSSQKPLFINIEGDVFEDERVTLEVYDVMGRLLFSDNSLSSHGTTEINVNQFSKGIFQLVLKDSGKIANRSLIIQ